MFCHLRVSPKVASSLGLLTGNKALNAACGHVPTILPRCGLSCGMKWPHLTKMILEKLRFENDAGE